MGSLCNTEVAATDIWQPLWMILKF